MRSTFLLFAQAVLDFAVMLPVDRKEWRVPKRIKKAYLPMSKRLMMNAEYTVDSWTDDFETTLAAATTMSMFAEDLSVVQILIREDNSR